MKTLNSPFCLVVALIAMVLSPTVVWSEQDRAYEQLRVIAEGYRANRALFTQGKCRFIYAVRTAANEEEAFRGVWSDHGPTLQAEYLLLQRGEVMVLKSEEDPNTVINDILAGKPNLAPLQAAINGPYAIDYDSATNTAHLHSPENHHLNVRMHPFNLAEDSERVDPASHVDAFFAKNPAERIQQLWVLEVQEEVPFEGEMYWRMQASVAPTFYKQDYIDPRRGFLPVVTEHYEKPWEQLLGRMKILETVEHEGMFFPVHAINVMTRRIVTPDGSIEVDRTHVDVSEMRVLEIDFDYVPTDEELAVPLHRETQFSDGVNPNTAITLNRESTREFVPVSAFELKSLYDQLQQLARDREQDAAARAARTEMVPEQSRSSSSLWLIIGLNATMVAAVTLLLIAKRQKKS